MGKSNVGALSSVALAVLIVGCSKGEGGPAAPPAPVPTAAAPPAPAGAAVPTAPTAASAPPPAPAWVRSGKAPSAAAILAALRARGGQGTSLLGRPLALGDGRFVSVAVNPAPGSHRVTVAAAVVSENGGQAQVESTVDLPAGTISNEVRGPSVDDSEVGDLDGDGKPEAMIFLRYRTPVEPVVGDTEYGQYFVVNADPTASIGASIRSQCHPEADAPPRWRAHVARADLDGDGHPDLRVRGKDCDDAQAEQSDSCRPMDDRYLWAAATDVWVRAGGPAKRP